LFRSCPNNHGLPRKVVSDRGPQFIVEFTQKLYRLLGIKLAATTAYHPQGDGQIKRVNQELEQYLHLFTNQRQDDWVGLLPFMEFQYNNQVHSSTQHPPFLFDTGCVPQMGFEPHQPRSHMESVNEFKDWHLGGSKGGSGQVEGRHDALLQSETNPSSRVQSGRYGLP